MNLTQPPFDDIHVRRAMNWIIDKAALRQVWGGPLIGKIAGHIVPDSIFDNQLTEYDPYRTPGDHGSLAKAKAAMKGSKYDVDAQRDVRSAGLPQRAAAERLAADVHADAADRSRPTRRSSGSRSTSRPIDGAFPTLQTTTKNIAIAIFPGWAKDYADALHVLQRRSSTAARSSRRATSTTRSSG